MSSKIGAEPGPARWSLAARLTAWYTASAFLLILAAVGYLYWALVANLDREDDQFLADKVHLLRSLLRERPNDLASLEREVREEWTARQYGHVYVRILDEMGRAVLETPGIHSALGPAAFPSPVAEEAVPNTGVEIATPDGKGYRLIAARAAVGGNSGRVWVLQLAFDRTYEEHLLARYRRDLLMVLGAAVVVCAFVGYQFARRGLAPLERMAATARGIGSNALDVRLPAGRLPPELHVLAVTFNDMLDRLQASFDRLSQFSADIAHELRTPVNNLRGEAEVALGQPRTPDEYRQVLGSCLEECARLANLIDSLLFLARAEHPETALVREPIDVGRELEVLRAYYEAPAVEAGVLLTLQVAATGPVRAEVDRTLFQRAVGNVIANALAHTPRGGTVAIAAHSSAQGLIVEISDTGRGISHEHLPHLFERFYRADSSRTQSGGHMGLGLAIARSIAVLHRGSASILSEVGKGTRVTLVFGREPR